MTRVVVVDDHPAVRAGLVAVLRSEPGLLPVRAVGTADDAVTAARQLDAEVAVVDYANA